MGMFDTVWVACPHCAELVGFQTKAGECVLADLDLKTTPDNIIRDAARYDSRCESCGATVALVRCGWCAEVVSS